MDKRQKYIDYIKTMREDGQRYEFNFFHEGGAVVYYCNGMYLLFEAPLYGGVGEIFEDIFHARDVEKMVDLALSWT